jgi:hypothetical protein
VSVHRCAGRWCCTAALLLVTLQGTACQGWHTEDVAPQEVLATHQPTQLRVTRTDGQQVVLQHPVLRGDTLEGVWQLGGYGTPAPVRIALTDVRQVATRGFSSDRTVVLAACLGAVVGGAILAIYALAPD